MIFRILKRAFIFLYLIKSISWLKLFRLYNRKSENILLVFATNRKDRLTFFFGAALVNDVALVKSFVEQKRSFRLCFNARKLLEVSNKTIYFNVSKHFTFFKGKNYSDSLLNFQKRLIKQSNTVYPKYESNLYWENKTYMHRQFSKLGISQPKTIIVDAKTPPPDIPRIAFPILYKPAHSSGSMGIMKLDNIEQYKEQIGRGEHEDYLLQKWVDMKRDLRLIYVGDELVVHYWRINEGAEWLPTSTGRGSSVDFEMLPTMWMDFIFKEYKKLDLHAGAFDIAWHKDDLSTKPLILEVSPSFMPNPAPVGKYKNKPYRTFKKSIFGKHAYYKEYIQLVFSIMNKLVKGYDGQ